MAIFKKESLEQLRSRIDLIEVLSPHLQLHRAGSSYKACCPFHEEKTPSFMIQKGESHYHCFGCGAHGDAIAFLMGYLKMNFAEAVESLAERFGVTLELEEKSDQPKGPPKALLKDALEKASRFYHFYLLHSEEGIAPLKYLYARGIDLDFIRLFQLGYAPWQKELFQRVMHAQGFDDEILEQTGLIHSSETGRRRDFFSDRITLPIRDPSGSVIGFSARKFKEETFGGKYINTPETILFKKSHTLFGLSYCRRPIAKERRAIIVEGQIDALRLIQAGFNITVAGQGTAFGEGHVKELLNLGVKKVYLCLDGDNAGQEAAVKVGDLFQKKGVEVHVAALPEGSDPDALLKERGPHSFLTLLEGSSDYLSFLVKRFSKTYDINTPTGKNELVQTIAAKIRNWEHPLLVHESLRKIAQLTKVPERMLGIGEAPVETHQVKKIGRISGIDIDPDKILEGDLIRWLFLMGETYPQLIEIAKVNLLPEHFRVEICRRLFTFYLKAQSEQKKRDLISFMIDLQAEEQDFLNELLQKKINPQRAEEGMIDTVRKLLQRHWMDQRESIKAKIHSGECSDEEVHELIKQFDEIKKKQPEVVLPCKTAT